MSRTPADPVAIIAMGALFPGRGSTHGFFRDLMEGTDALGDVPESHWRIADYYDPDPRRPDRTYGRRGGFLKPQAFDPMRYGLPPSALASTDTSQLLALMIADGVMAEVEAHAQRPVDRSRTAVILGVASATELTGHMSGRLQRPIWEKALRESGLDADQVTEIVARIEAEYVPWTEATFPGLLGNVVAGRIANRLDLGGANYVTDAACASSLSALQAALHELRSGNADMALAGGADTLNDILMYMCFSKTPALSATEDCRPFSDAADGTMLGEGVGLVALKRLVDAERDGNRIHAVIRGIGGGSDGRATAIYAPLPSGQSRTLQRAYDEAGYSPRTVDLVEAHGTGTRAGDKAEIEGLCQVFDPDRTASTPWCAIGSVKSQIGHTKAAAGAASLIKVAGALSRRFLPPTLKVVRPAPALAGSPFYVNTTSRPWVRRADHPRRAAVSSFGFGGSNFHVTLEEYTGEAAAEPTRLLPEELFLFSARDATGLVRQMTTLLEAAHAEEALPEAADRLHLAFDPAAPVRAYVLGRDPERLAASAGRLIKAIEAGTAGKTPFPQEIGYAEGEPDPGDIAFLFSGQGSQYIGMGADLALAFPQALKAWDEAAAHPALAPLALHDIAFPPAAFSDEARAAQSARLTAMEHAQPAIAVTALAQLDLLAAAGLRARFAGGHSFGEVMALHYAGAFTRSTALSLARARGVAMAEAATGTDGAMLAVQASAETLRPWLKTHGEVTLANDNGPWQVALSGPREAISALETALTEAGFKAKRLPVATAFHSPIVAAAVAPFTDTLEAATLRSPRLPVYANVTARRYPRDPAKLPDLLASQIAQPVRFREMVEAMYAAGARTFIEVGPSSVVAGLTAAILETRPALVVALDHKRMNGASAFLAAIGKLAIAGHDVDVQSLLRGMPAPPPPPPRPKFAVDIDGANYGKPYPPRKVERSAPPVPVAGSQTGPDGAPPPKTARPPSPPAPAPSPEPSIQPAASPPATAVESEETDMPPSHRAEDLAQLRAIVSDLTDAHRTYLDTVARLVGLDAGSVRTALPDPAQTGRMAPAPSPSPVPQPVSGSAPGPVSVPVPEPSPDAAPRAVRSNGHDVAPSRAEPHPQPEAPPASTPPPGQNDADALAGQITAIVSEKTGYPTDMLDLDMALESELGVDSIKQVEILAAIRERVPGLPEITPEQAADLATIRDIATFLAGSAATAASPAAVSAQRPPPQPEPYTLPEGTAQAPTIPAPQPANGSAAASDANGHGPAAGNGTEDLADTLRELIAEKTGYPNDMLEDDMDLEAELGVDSIKQVEILAALRDARPDLPELSPEQASELRSIREIADFFR